MTKKAIGEFIGTYVLVLLGTGTAVLGGGVLGVGIVGIAMAFGFSFIVVAYTVASVSGCHINPAVSIAMYMNKRINMQSLMYYIISQLLGAITASLTLIVFLRTSNLPLNNLGQNTFGLLSVTGAFLVEFILSFLFILVVMVVTGKKGNKPLAGFIIGLTLLLVHLIGIPLTGTSVNPARSFAPALFAGGVAIFELWVFILAPILGGIVAALVAKHVLDSEK